MLDAVTGAPAAVVGAATVALGEAVMVEGALAVTSCMADARIAASLVLAVIRPVLNALLASVSQMLVFV